LRAVFLAADFLAAGLRRAVVFLAIAMLPPFPTFLRDLSGVKLP
jgi:hypothetical protein